MRSSGLACLLVVAAAVGDAAAFFFTLPEWGRCPPVTVQQGFDLDSYTGRWYELSGYNTAVIEGDCRCVRADYMPTPGQSDQIDVYNWGLSQRTNKPVSINGTAEPTDLTKDEGKLVLTFYMFFGLIPVRGNYWVLGTDYDTYSLVYGCSNIFIFWHYKAIWGLSRSQSFATKEDEDAFNEAIATLIWKNHLTPGVTLTPSDQTNCQV